MVHGRPTAAGARLLASSLPLQRSYDLAVLDLDGVLYIGPDAVPGAPQALQEARKAGMAACFVTNNASRPAVTVAEHLTRLGIPATGDDVVTSAQVAAAMLARRLPRGAPVLVIGGEGLRSALTEHGLRPVSSVDELPKAVVQGFHPDLSWRDLAEGTRAVRSGLFWMATNLDLTVPTPFGPAPGNGALVGLVGEAAGRGPDAVAGKPRPSSFLEAARRYGSTRPLVVGDRLDTDLEGARAAGQDGLLVLTGVSGAADVLSCPPQRRPGYLGRDLTALQQPHPPVSVEPLVTVGPLKPSAATGPLAVAGPGAGTGLQARCGAATVVVDDGCLRVDPAGDDALDVLRAAAQAMWTWADAAGTGAEAAGDAMGTVTAAPVLPDLGPVLDAIRRLEPDVTWAR